jgi:general secretion pathway protein A
MYESYYGLNERPFDLVPNPRFLFLSNRQREALGNLRLGLTTPRGLTVMLGEAGTGKTTLLHAVLAELTASDFEYVLVSNPTLTRDEFYEYLTDGFRLPSAVQGSKTQFLIEFRRHLLNRSEAGKMTALVLDESQSLSHELLEEVRLLSNIETPTTKLLNVVLAGQPELSARLNDPSLRQLKQRISLRCELSVFDFAETATYIAGRLRIAGGDPTRIFTREAVIAIREASGGVPRTINVVCDNALIGGFATQTKPVPKVLVDEVCRDFDLSRVKTDRDSGAAAQLSAPEPAPMVEPPPAEETAPEEPTRRKRFSIF